VIPNGMSTESNKTGIDNIDAKNEDKLKKCEHYNIGCHILFECCGEYYSCRFCHDEKTTDSRLSKNSTYGVHEHDKLKMTHIMCRFCLNVQKFSDTCNKCQQKMGNYFCEKCKLLDLDDKGQFHCVKCGICRKGGKDNFIHCDKCGICVVKSDNHKCAYEIGGSCPICCEELFTSILATTSTNCGHWMHSECLTDFLKTDYRCPLCFKSLVDTTHLTTYLDTHVASTQMPDEYKDKLVDILCNDCGIKCTVKMHFYGNKCNKCGSYNTKLS
jgi:RING finger/CHY zinc finger protein 1